MSVAASLKKAKEDLNLAYRYIISMFPEEVLKLYDKSVFVNTFEDYVEWRHNFIEAVLEIAEIIPDSDKNRYSSSPRAYCPLCGYGGTGGWNNSNGYAFPVGLDSHLRGHGNTQECYPMKIACTIVKDKVK